MTTKTKLNVNLRNRIYKVFLDTAIRPQLEEFNKKVSEAFVPFYKEEHKEAFQIIEDNPAIKDYISRYNGSDVRVVRYDKSKWDQVNIKLSNYLYYNNRRSYNKSNFYVNSAEYPKDFHVFSGNANISQSEKLETIISELEDEMKELKAKLISWNEQVYAMIGAAKTVEEVFKALPSLEEHLEDLAAATKTPTYPMVLVVDKAINDYLVKSRANKDTEESEQVAVEEATA